MGIHHIYTRGTKRWTLFHDDVDRRHFLGILSIVCDRYHMTVLAFSLMDNHIHLVVQCPEAGLSHAMRDLKSIYARRFNQRHRSSGPIFEDRFGSKLVTSYLQLRILIRYVHRNPYAIDPALDLASQRWTSHGIYLGLHPAPVWFDRGLALGLFTDYRSDIETPLATDAVQNDRSTLRTTRDVPGTSRVAAEAPLSAILVAVARAARCSIADVSPRRRNGLIGVAVVLALDYAGFTAAETAEPFGYRTAKAVQNIAPRVRRRLRSDSELREVLAAAQSQLEQAAA